MNQNLDKTKLKELIQKAKPQDLLYVNINPTDKNSKNNALIEIEKFIGNGIIDIYVTKKK